MPRLISDVLGAAEPHFTHTILEWERRSGNPSHDVRLISDVHRRRRRAIGQLGMDQKDTTARELYFALCKRALEDSDKFASELKITPADSGQKMVEAAVNYVEALTHSRELWVVKQSFIKSVLKENPPKKLMKLLGLRSIDSVIKRANVSEFLALSYVAETEVWSTKLHNAYKKIRVGDLQTANSSIIVVTKKSQDALAKAGYMLPLVHANYETGAVLVSQPKERFQSDGLSLVLAILEAMSELRVYSAYFRHISVRNDFGLCFSEALSQGLPSSTHAIGWRDLQRYLASDEELFDKIKQPHFQDEELHAPSAVEALANTSPILSFWTPLEGVFHSDSSGLVSCHLLDILSGVANELEPEQMPLHYVRSRLWQDLAARYLAEKHLQAEILKNIV